MIQQLVYQEIGAIERNVDVKRGVGITVGIVADIGQIEVTQA